MGKNPKLSKEGEDSFQFTVTSIPPNGMCKVLELYVDPNTGKLIVVYDDNPVNHY